MKGWEFTKTNEPLRLVEKPDPVAGPGTVIIYVKASGLCHTDCGTLVDPGWMNILAKVPIILGHEIAGEIIEIGPEVTDYKVGDRVAVCPVGKDGLGPGNGRDGGYADKVLVPAVDVGAYLLAEVIGAKQCIFVKDVDGLYTDNPKVDPDAEFIPKIGAKELLNRDLDDLVVERVVLELLTRAQNMRQVQIINGTKEGNITRALNGEHVGTIIYKDI